MGNPSVHSLSFLTYGPVFLRALRSRNFYAASTVDQMLKHVSGCSATRAAPDMRRRLRELRERGGKVVVWTRGARGPPRRPTSTTWC